jgi:hypothetical protein
MIRMFLSALIFLTSFNVFAQQEASALPKNDNRNSMIIDTSSAGNRANKNVSLYLESAAGSFISSGLTVGLFLNSKSQILIDAYSNQTSLFSDIYYFGIHDTLKSNSVGAHYKRFLGNSFFIRGGANYRQVNFERTNKYWFSSTTDISSFSGDGGYAVIGIGNDWQMSHFTIGADWLRIDVPLNTQITDFKTNSSNQTILDSEKDKYLINASAMIGFHLGASF